MPLFATPALQNLIGAYPDSLPLRVKMILACRDPDKLVPARRLRELLLSASLNSLPPACPRGASQVARLQEARAIFLTEPDFIPSSPPNVPLPPRQSALLAERSAQNNDANNKDTLIDQSHWVLRAARQFNGRSTAEICSSIDIPLQEDNEWLSTPPFGTKWQLDKIKTSRLLSIRFDIFAPSVVRRLQDLEAWVQQEVASQSIPLFGETLSVGDIDTRNAYRSSLYFSSMFSEGSQADPSKCWYAPNLEASVVLTGGDATLVELDLIRGNPVELLHRVRKVILDGSATTRFRFQAKCRPQSIYTYLPANCSQRRCGLNLKVTELCIRSCKPPETS